jgi:signal transduction histidine kinase
MASSDLDMPDMLRGLHAIVGSLMYAENFFIALHDPIADTIRFIYFADVADNDRPDPEKVFPMTRFERGLTWYVIRDRHPLMGTHEQLREQISGPWHQHGTDSLDWLGVPMVRGSTAYGALVVQSYVERPRYTTGDQALLSFVGSHILTALERKQAQEELERRVDQRTHDLAKANDVLTAEVLERQRGERLQKSLFRIAELSNAAGSMEEFYVAIHEIVGELIDATNFYIALISPDGSELQFPYLVDERDEGATSRKFGSGATEYVIRTRRALLAELADIERLHAMGEINLVGPPPQSWLGVPLVCAENVVGVVTVQSYSPQVRYTARDQELLTFVSHQIANSLERRRAANALKVANTELERRVEERTSQLSEQISVRQLVEVALQQRNTELESLNSKLAGTQSQLLQSEKMASVGQLAAGVAHEINNPIGYVHSNLTSLTRYVRNIFSILQAYEQLEKAVGGTVPELVSVTALKKSIELDFVREDIVNLLAESVEGVTRVEKIVKDLKDFSRVDEAEWQQADIHEGINSTLNVVAHELKYKGNLVKEYGDLPPIQCLPFQLKQVFMNLLVNAAHAIEQRGTITIRTGRDGDYVWVTIADTGHGIDPRHLNRIFEPFFTTKPVGVGTGLGLSVSYSIIKKHNGTLDVASELGKGTTFTIRLPIIQTDTANQ